MEQLLKAETICAKSEVVHVWTEVVDVGGRKQFCEFLRSVEQELAAGGLVPCALLLALLRLLLGLVEFGVAAVSLSVL